MLKQEVIKSYLMVPIQPQAYFHLRDELDLHYF